MRSNNEENRSVVKSAETPEDVNEERREALRRIGKFGTYTAPALLAMLVSEKAPAVTDK
jgi:hypothetical protein